MLFKTFSTVGGATYINKYGIYSLTQCEFLENNTY